MPKIIEGAQKRILAFAKETLMKSGYVKLTIRGVARECGMAVGTVYNYYASKEMLAASVMVDDWMRALAEMRAACGASTDIPQGLRAIHGAVVEFSRVYAPIWGEFPLSGKTAYSFSDRHRLLRSQMCEIIGPLLDRLDAENSEQIRFFIAENLLTAASDSTINLDETLVFIQKAIRK